jgi:hypothetical protein
VAFPAVILMVGQKPLRVQRNPNSRFRQGLAPLLIAPTARHLAGRELPGMKGPPSCSTGQTGVGSRMRKGNCLHAQTDLFPGTNIRREPRLVHSGVPARWLEFSFRKEKLPLARQAILGLHEAAKCLCAKTFGE